MVERSRVEVCTVLYCSVLYCTVQAGGWGMNELRVFPGCETPGNLFIDAGDTQQEENGGTEQVTGSVSGFPPVYLQTGQLGEEVT